MLNLYKVCLYSSLIFSISLQSFAQSIKKDSTKKDSTIVTNLANTNNPYVPNNIPPSANAASLGKYGDSPVSYYTGSASTGVQLYTIVSKDLSVPLSVSYHHGGIKVESIKKCGASTFIF